MLSVSIWLTSTRELDRINGSMFSGMFGPGKRTMNKRDLETLAQYKEDKEKAEETARAAYASEQQMEDTFKTMNGNRPSGSLGASRNTAERSKFVFKDDESDDELAEQDQNDEDQIQQGVADLMDITGKLKGAAIGMGTNLDTQNQRLDRLAGKVSSLIANLDYLVTSINMRLQTDAVDDRVSQPWHSKSPVNSAYLCLGNLRPFTNALWMLNTALNLRTLLPQYRPDHLLLTCNHTGPDEPREVEPHPLNTTNTSHQCNSHARRRTLTREPGVLYCLARMVLRRSVGSHGFVIGILSTFLNCTMSCEMECMHGRPGDKLRSPNENVSQSVLPSNPRREIISGASCLTIVFHSESARRPRHSKTS